MGNLPVVASCPGRAVGSGTFDVAGEAYAAARHDATGVRMVAGQMAAHETAAGHEAACVEADAQRKHLALGGMGEEAVGGSGDHSVASSGGMPALVDSLRTQPAPAGC